MGYAMQEVLSEEDRTLRLYFHDITGLMPLSREREVELAARIQQGDLQARDELVQANLCFVVDVAKHYQNRGLSLADRISAGNVGLITAAERFDGTKGFKFISYAVWWIRQSILQTIGEQVRTVRLPLNRLNLLQNIAKTSWRLGQGREREPDVEEVATELGVPVEEVVNTLLSGRAVVSLDKVFAFEEGDLNGLPNALADPRQELPDVQVLRDSAREQLEGALNNLDERESHILRLYFGLDGEEMLTLAQIGAGLGITRERVRQLKKRALSKLRHPTRYPALRAMVGEGTPAG